MYFFQVFTKNKNKINLSDWEDQERKIFQLNVLKSIMLLGYKKHLVGLSTSHMQGMLGVSTLNEASG